MTQLEEYKTLQDLGLIACRATRRIQEGQFPHYLWCQAWRSTQGKIGVSGHLTDVPMDSVYYGIVSRQGIT